MIKNFVRTTLTGIILSALSFIANGQDTTPAPKTSSRPDIPGIFTLEVGLNRGLTPPDTFNIGLWGSRTVNVYYQYDFRILKSRFSFVPGIGVSLERFKFKNNDSLAVTSETTVGLLGPGTGPRPRKSQLITNYVDVPLELRYSTRPDDPNRSLKIGIGARVGYMYDSFSKLKYKVDGDIYKTKDKHHFNLNRFRYGAFVRLGAGNFSIVGYYNMTNLFKDGKGFVEDGVAKDFNTYTVCLSFASF